MTFDVNEWIRGQLTELYKINALKMSRMKLAQLEMDLAERVHVKLAGEQLSPESKSYSLFAEGLCQTELDNYLQGTNLTIGSQRHTARRVLNVLPSVLKRIEKLEGDFQDFLNTKNTIASYGLVVDIKQHSIANISTELQALSQSADRDSSDVVTIHIDDIESELNQLKNSMIVAILRYLLQDITTLKAKYELLGGDSHLHRIINLLVLFSQSSSRNFNKVYLEILEEKLEGNLIGLLKLLHSNAKESTLYKEMRITRKKVKPTLRSTRRFLDGFIDEITCVQTE
ncbi:hypothetical protein PCE1_003812 [Barthelona sp. PCE]